MYCRDCGQLGDHDCELSLRLLELNDMWFSYCPRCGSHVGGGYHLSTWGAGSKKGEALWCDMTRTVREMLEAGWRPLSKGRWAWGRLQEHIPEVQLKALADRYRFPKMQLVALRVEVKNHIRIFPEQLMQASRDFVIASSNQGYSSAALATWVPEPVAVAGRLLNYPKRTLSDDDLAWGASPLFFRGLQLMREGFTLQRDILSFLHALAASGDRAAVNGFSMVELKELLQAKERGMDITKLVREAGVETLDYLRTLRRVV